MLVDHSELLSGSGEIETANGRTDLQQIDGEGIVHEDFHHLAALEADQKALATRRTAGHFDVTDERIQDPLFLFHSGKRVTLESEGSAESRRLGDRGGGKRFI